MKKLTPLIYICFLTIIFLYVRSVLKVDQISIIQKESDKNAFEVHPAKVFLTVEYNGNMKTYSLSMKNEDSIFDLLNQLREKDDLYFEITQYTHGLKIEQVYNIKTSEIKEWKLYYKDQDITNNIKDTLIEDGGKYYLRPES